MTAEQAPAVAVDDDARFLRSFTGLPKHFNTRLTAIADRLQSLQAPKEGSYFQAMKAASDEIASLQASIRVKDEALRDIRSVDTAFIDAHEGPLGAINAIIERARADQQGGE